MAVHKDEDKDKKKKVDEAVDVKKIIKDLGDTKWSVDDAAHSSFE